MAREKELSPLGQRIDDKLNRRTVTWLAKETGLSRTTIIDAMSGSIPSVEKALKIAQALGTTVEFLVTGQTSAPVASPDFLLVPQRSLHEFDGDGRPILKSHVPVARAMLGRFSPELENLWVAHMPPSSLPDCAAPGDLILCTDPVMPLAEGYYIFTQNGAADVSGSPIFARRYRLHHRAGMLEHEIWDASQAEPYFWPSAKDGGFIGGVRPIARIIGPIRIKPAI